LGGTKNDNEEPRTKNQEPRTKNQERTDYVVPRNRYVF
jgi:hypothetical protein